MRICSSAAPSSLSSAQQVDPLKDYGVEDVKQSRAMMTIGLILTCLAALLTACGGDGGGDGDDDSGSSGYGQEPDTPVTIEITGTTDSDGFWYIDTYTGTFDDAQTVLESQVWWEDEDLAEKFALALDQELGFEEASGWNFGPWFAHMLEVVGGDTEVVYARLLAVPGTNSTYVNTDIRSLPTESRRHATATRHPKPGTLSLVGLGLVGMGLKRGRRNHTS